MSTVAERLAKLFSGNGGHGYDFPVIMDESDNENYWRVSVDDDREED